MLVPHLELLEVDLTRAVLVHLSQRRVELLLGELAPGELAELSQLLPGDGAAAVFVHAVEGLAQEFAVRAVVALFEQGTKRLAGRGRHLLNLLDALSLALRTQQPFQNGPVDG